MRYFKLFTLKMVGKFVNLSAKFNLYKLFKISLIFTDKTRYYNENFARKTFHQICQKYKAKYREMGLKFLENKFHLKVRD